MSVTPALAHSAPGADREPQSYCDHVQGSLCVAMANGEVVASYMADRKIAKRFLSVVVDGVTFHYLGKLDPDNQEALRQGRRGRMRWDHVDAGVAHLMASGAKASALIVRAHRAPGLLAIDDEFNLLDPAARGLRGGRACERDPDEADKLTAHTDQTLANLLATHVAAIGVHAPTRSAIKGGLFTRLALSCLVDGDHADSACMNTNDSLLPSPSLAGRNGSLTSTLISQT